jgi:TetR/AcrR family transcriptional repressor of nem operon
MQSRTALFRIGYTSHIASYTDRGLDNFGWAEHPADLAEIAPPQDARTKEFEPRKALETAMNVFWRFGYEHTSLDVLMRETGIARQSLYDTFGDKRALYLQALTQYRDNDHGRLRRLFASGQPVKEGFATILLGISGESREEHQRGCLLLSANMERDAKDKVIAAFLLDNQLKTEAIFTEALRRAQASGEVSDKHDPVALARFFVETIQGMRAMAKGLSQNKYINISSELIHWS